MKGPEAYFEGGPFLDRAHERAQKILGENVIDQRSFGGLYPQAEIDRDLATVRRFENKFQEESTLQEREDKKLATIFEAIFHDGLTRGRWLGEDVNAIKPSRFDDIVNKVDSIVEFQKGVAVEREDKSASYLALAMDVTFGSHVEEKLRRIKNVEIGEGKLTQIKYFESRYLGGQLELSGVPRVVVGADRETVKGLVEVWLSGDEKALEAHPLRAMVLEEIRMQLEAFEAYARSQKHDAEAAVYHEASMLVRDIMQTKRAQGDTSSFRHDRVFNGIFHYLKNFTGAY